MEERPAARPQARRSRRWREARPFVARSCPGGGTTGQSGASAGQVERHAHPAPAREILCARQTGRPIANQGMWLSNQCGARFNLRRMDRLLSMTMFVCEAGCSRHEGAPETAATGECHDGINAGVPHRDRASTAQDYQPSLAKPLPTGSRIWSPGWSRSRSTSVERAGGPSRCCRRALRRRNRRPSRSRYQPGDQRDGAIVMGHAIALLSAPGRRRHPDDRRHGRSRSDLPQMDKGLARRLWPELHYMRGPGPKMAREARRCRSASFDVAAIGRRPEARSIPYGRDRSNSSPQAAAGTTDVRRDDGSYRCRSRSADRDG